MSAWTFFSIDKQRALYLIFGHSDEGVSLRNWPGGSLESQQFFWLTTMTLRLSKHQLVWAVIYAKCHWWSLCIRPLKLTERHRTGGLERFWQYFVSIWRSYSRKVLWKPGGRSLGPQRQRNDWILEISSAVVVFSSADTQPQQYFSSSPLIIPKTSVSTFPLRQLSNASACHSALWAINLLNC